MPYFLCSFAQLFHSATVYFHFARREAIVIELQLSAMCTLSEQWSLNFQTFPSERNNASKSPATFQLLTMWLTQWIPPRRKALRSTGGFALFRVCVLNNRWQDMFDIRLQDDEAEDLECSCTDGVWQPYWHIVSPQANDYCSFQSFLAVCLGRKCSDLLLSWVFLQPLSLKLWCWTPASGCGAALPAWAGGSVPQGHGPFAAHLPEAYQVHC